MHQKAQIKGFTIVELLIVIVVIAILAVIVIVSYSGLQKRARYVQTTSAIKGYYTGLLAYKEINGAYPVLSERTCLGENLPKGMCFNDIAFENTSFSAELKTIMGGTLPKVAQGPKVGIKPGDMQNPVYLPLASKLKLDGVPTVFIYYTVEDGATQKCPVGPIVGYTGSTLYLTSTPVGDTSYNNVCILPLPM